MSAPAGWEDILDPDEQILWQGRPDGKIVLDASGILSLIFGLFFAGFALVWMVVAFKDSGGFWAFGLIHFSAGLAIAFGSTGWSVFRRRHTWYTLTDRRAFVATEMPVRGRGLKSYPITSDMMLDITHSDPPSVWFREETYRTKNGTGRKRTGFERIADGQDVFRLIRDLQSQMS